MSNSEHSNIEEIINKKNSREKKFRIRSFILFLFIVSGGILWLYWTNSQVNKMNQKVSTLNDTLKVKQQRIEQLNDTVALKQHSIEVLKNDLAQLNEYLHEADNFKNYMVEILPIDKKHYLFSDEINDQLKLVFSSIIEFQNQNIQFDIDGKLPNEGFNSPSFISYVLNQNGITNKVELSSSRLIANFEKSSGNYKSGDLLIYESGYCMLYFSNNLGTGTFVLGMTPSGILALKEDFANVKAHLRPKYN